MQNNKAKQQAAIAALNYIKDGMIVGVGTGSTMNFFIEALATIKHRIDACVASSIETERRLKSFGIPVIDLNSVSFLPIYIDGADEVNPQKQLIKGGGGALTREKILAYVAEQFICIIDPSKQVLKLGKFPIAVEVLPMARSLAAREIVKLGGEPEYRTGFTTDNGNIILDVHTIELPVAIDIEEKLKLIPGVVENGIFAKRTPEVLIVGND